MEGGYMDELKQNEAHLPLLQFPPETLNVQKKKTPVKWYRALEWMQCWVGFIFLGLCILLSHFNVEAPVFKRWDSDPSKAFTVWTAGIPILYLAMLISLSAALKLSRTDNFEFKKFTYGFTIIFLAAALSKWIGTEKHIGQVHIGDSIWSIFFGMLLVNVSEMVPSLASMKPNLTQAKKTELYIAVSLVLLVLDIDQLKPLVGRAFFVAWIDTPILISMFSIIGFYFFTSIDKKQIIILTATTVVCGSSAAIAISSAIQGTRQQENLAIFISSFLTVPSIIILPIIANVLNFSNDIAGAWFGGSIDSTGAVLATSSTFDSDSTAPGAVVKMVQNVLIAPFSVFMAWFYLKNRSWLNGTSDDDTPEKKTESSFKLFWNQFPKFVLGFIISIIIFNLVVVKENRDSTNKLIFPVSEWFSTCSFVSIGISLPFSEIRKQSNVFHAIVFYLLVQLVDICVTGGMAYAAFTKF